MIGNVPAQRWTGGIATRKREVVTWENNKAAWVGTCFAKEQLRRERETRGKVGSFLVAIWRCGGHA